MKVNIYRQTSRVFLGTAEIQSGQKLPDVGEKITSVEGVEYTVVAFSTTRNMLGELAEAIVQ